jgi:uncharacterized membrane protein (DUF485 family)
MASSVPSEPQERWIACPRCHIANIAGGYCTVCGAWLTPGVPEPRYGRSGASPRQWALLIGVCAVLIGVPLYAAFNPDRVIAGMFKYGYPFAYGVATLSFAARAVWLLRRRSFAWAITLGMFAILFCMLMMAELDAFIS